MKIIIKKVDKIADQIFIEFESILGNGFGEWRTKTEPQVSASYFVELDVEDNLVWQNNVTYAENKETLIRSIDKSLIEIQGSIEAVEDSGRHCFMRLAEDLFVFSCSKMPTEIHDYVKIRAKKIRVYDMNL